MFSFLKTPYHQESRWIRMNQYLLNSQEVNTFCDFLALLRVLEMLSKFNFKHFLALQLQ